MHKSFKFVLLGLLFLVTFQTKAAVPIDFPRYPVSYLETFSLTDPKAPYGLQKINQDKDFNQTDHMRLKQTYLGYPVWGGDIIIHSDSDKNTSANGRIYASLAQDLKTPPENIIDGNQSALQIAMESYQHKIGKPVHFSLGQVSALVYLDENFHAHWALLVKFSVTTDDDETPSRMCYILDALNFKVYREWDEVQTLSSVSAGGFGGNKKTGKHVYDGKQGDFPLLKIERDPITKTCFLKNELVTVRDARKRYAIIEFPCEKPNSNLYWDGDIDAINGGFSPANDAFFAGQVIQDMYQSWYSIPALSINNKPMVLDMWVHKRLGNAYWNGYAMTFGDGGKEFYPLVSLGIAAHEISHGFTQQQSGLLYIDQPGGLNESFSDMAAEAAEYYATGKNTWQIGAEILKTDGKALRYLDEPTKDCEGKFPGDNCSINHIKDFTPELNPHFSSGIFNKVFYVIATSPHWNTKKAFDIMVQANRFYWTPLTNFAEAACGVMSSARDYHYDLNTVKRAFSMVGIDVGGC